MLIPLSFWFYKTHTCRSSSLKLLFETQPSFFLTFAKFQLMFLIDMFLIKNECNQKNDYCYFCEIRDFIA